MYECKQVVDLYQLLQSEASNQRQLKRLWIIKLKLSIISFDLHESEESMGSTLSLKPRADISRGLNQGY